MFCPSGTLSAYRPSKSVTVPTLVPLTSTLAPIRGDPSEPVTVPVMVLCARAEATAQNTITMSNESLFILILVLLKKGNRNKCLKYFLSKAISNQKIFSLP